MPPIAVRIIKEEHVAISAVLFSLRFLVRRVESEGGNPDFRLLRAMMDYIVDFPERLHHPKENEYLFRRVREREPAAAALIDELEAEHARGDRLIDELKAALLRYEREGHSAFPEFKRAVDDYADFHWDHMRKEEDHLLPLAEKSLTEEDWDAVGEAFRLNDNPLFGLKPKEHAEELFQRILRLAPAPIGLGAEDAAGR